MDAGRIDAALAHLCSGQHIFFSQVKLGPSYGPQGFRQMDAVAIRKSWTRHCVTGYEIKVSRGDFTRDEKWPEYLSACHRFYWVSPKNLIKPDEIDPRTGLVWYDEQADVCRVRKAAPFRDVELPADLFLYLILWRLGDKPDGTRDARLAAAREWLADRRTCGRLGHELGTRLARAVGDQAIEIEGLKDELSGWQEAGKKLGIESPYDMVRLAGNGPPIDAERVRATARYVVEQAQRLLSLVEPVKEGKDG